MAVRCGQSACVKATFCDRLSNANQRQDRHDDDDQTDNIDNIMHQTSPRFSVVTTARADCCLRGRCVFDLSSVKRLDQRKFPQRVVNLGGRRSFHALGSSGV